LTGLIEQQTSTFQGSNNLFFESKSFNSEKYSTLIYVLSSRWKTAKKKTIKIF